MESGNVYGSRGMSTSHSGIDESPNLDGEKDEERDPCLEEKMSCLASDLSQHSTLATPPGISRQQLINRYSKKNSILFSLAAPFPEPTQIITC